MRIAVVSLSDRKELCIYTWTSLKKYCKTHKYKFETCNHLLTNERHPCWSKILFLKTMLNKYSVYDYVVWMDDDILITNPEIKIEDIITKFSFNKKEEYVLVSNDLDGFTLNNGVIVFKTGKKSIDFLNFIWNNSPVEKYWIACHEQDVMADFYNTKNNKDILVIPFCNLQSFYKECPDCFKWKPGHFAAHVSYGEIGDRVKRIKEVFTALKNNIYFYTYITKDNTEQSNSFMRFIDKNKINVNILSDDVFTNYSRKMFTLRDAITPLDNYDIVVFTDAFDVLYLQSEEYIYKAFLRTGARIIFNAEVRYGNQSVEYQSYFENKTQSRYKYLNSGAYIGYKRNIMNMLNWCLTEENLKESNEWVVKNLSWKYNLISEQYIMGKYMALHPGEISLDYNRDVFCNIVTEWDDFDDFFSIIKNKLYSKPTKTYPCILHSPCISKRHIFVDIANKLFDKT